MTEHEAMASSSPEEISTRYEVEFIRGTDGLSLEQTIVLGVESPSLEVCGPRLRDMFSGRIVMLGRWLDLKILRIFSNLNSPMIP